MSTRWYHKMMLTLYIMASRLPHHGKTTHGPVPSVLNKNSFSEKFARVWPKLFYSRDECFARANVMSVQRDSKNEGAFNVRNLMASLGLLGCQSLALSNQPTKLP